MAGALNGAAGAGAALNLGAAGGNPANQLNLAGLAGMLPPELAQQQAAMNQLNPNQQPQLQDASQLNMHLLNIAIACEMQR